MLLGLGLGGAGGLELTFQPWLAINIVERLQDLELAVSLRFANVDIFREVHVRLRLHRSAWASERHAGLPRCTNLVHIEAAGLLDRGFPEINSDIAQHH